MFLYVQLLAIPPPYIWLELTTEFPLYTIYNAPVSENSYQWNGVQTSLKKTISTKINYNQNKTKLNFTKLYTTQLQIVIIT